VFRLLALLLGLLVLASPAQAKREHVVHFQGTAYELHVFTIEGQQPGKTLMLIGGIQGNEPGGFLSADLYADMSLAKGSLIVVPRANFYSIVLNKRGPNGDMNRKFDKPAKPPYEAEIVAILKGLMAKADCLLNLHDGSGFYRPTNVSETMNPMRYGQSIIADADVYRFSKNGRVLRLGDLARSICAEINQSVENPLYYFHFNNHRTVESNSPHLEQRGSATYYALTKLGIPAFGIETSKDLPTIELKVRHHNLAINAFMRALDIVSEHPGVDIKAPELSYLVVSVNRGQPMVVSNRETLELKRGDSVFISHIESNYERGLSVDILGLGGLNDARRSFKIDRSTSVIVRKDHLQCGWIRLAVGDGKKEIETREVEAEKTAESNPVAQYFVIQVNAEERLVASGQTIRLVEGDRLKLLDAWTPQGQKGLFALNFKGFVTNKRNNNGDDRNVLISTHEGLMPDWSLGGKGRRYKVVAERGDRDYGEFYVQLTEPSLDYLIVRTGQRAKYAVAPGETLFLDPDAVLELVDLKANFDTGTGLQFQIRNGTQVVDLPAGRQVRLKDLLAGQALVKEGSELVVLRYEKPIGRILLVPRPYTAGSGEPGQAG